MAGEWSYGWEVDVVQKQCVTGMANLLYICQCSKVIMFSRFSYWFSFCVGQTNKQTKIDSLNWMDWCLLCVVINPKKLLPLQFLIVLWDSLVLEKCCESKILVWGFRFCSGGLMEQNRCLGSCLCTGSFSLSKEQCLCIGKWCRK